MKTPARYFKKVQNLSKQLEGFGSSNIYMYICMYVYIYTQYKYISYINSHLFGMVGLGPFGVCLAIS